MAWMATETVLYVACFPLFVTPVCTSTTLILAALFYGR